MSIIDGDRWRILEPLLDRALEMSAGERDAWLEVLRAESPELATELSSLLSAEGEADRRGFLAERPPATLAGLQLGAYTLERPLGQGGMGSVWLARRTDGRFEGRAAVKLMSLALLSPTGQERFRREGTALARLTHPGIARLLDAGVAPSGQPYLVIEYVDGQRIDAFADTRGLSREERIRLVLQVLDAVGHAHANLIVHRDLKPSNIFVTADGAVKLLDFGIAKLLEGGSGEERAALTADGCGALTPDYAAPEQVRGEAVTTATDVYALGVLLYLLLSGRHPTGAGSHTPAEAVRGVLEVEPTPLGLGDLDTVIGKALRKAPSERYQTVTALADDLRRYLRQEPVSARPDSLAYRARKFVRRNRAAVAAAAAVAMVLVGATGFSVRQMQEAQRQRDTAVHAKKRADAQIEFQSLLMSEIGDRPVTMRELLDKGRAVLEQQYAGNPRVLASLLRQMAESYENVGDRKTSKVLVTRAESIAVAVGDSGQLSGLRCELAYFFRVEGPFDAGWRVLAAADSLLRIAPDPESELTCLDNRAGLAMETGRGGEAVRAMRRAIAIKDSLGETRDVEYLELLGTLAAALEMDGRYRDAVAMHHRVVAAMDGSGRGGTFSSVVARHNWALTLAALGETAEAERLFRDVLARATRANPSGRIHAQILVHYAQAAYYQGLADAAVRYFALLAAQAVEDDTSGYWEGRATFGLAQAQLLRGDTAEARRTAARFRQVRARHPEANLEHTDDHIVDARVLDSRLALAAGDTAGAHAGVVEALRARGYFGGARTPQLHPALILASETAVALGRPAVALGFARDARVVATRDSLTETRSAHVGEARLVEGRALLASGDRSAARASLERALPALRTGAGASHVRTREAQALLAALRQ